MPPARYGCDRDQSVPDASRDSRQGVGPDPELGEERAAIFYRQVLKIDEPSLTDFAAARQGKRLQVVLPVAEVLKVSALGLVVVADAAPKLFFQIFQADICRVSGTPRDIDSRTFAARLLHSAQSVPILPAGSSAGNRLS